MRRWNNIYCRVRNNLQLALRGQFGGGITPAHQAPEYNPLWRLSRTLLSPFFKLRPLPFPSPFALDSSSTGDIDSVNPYHGSILLLRWPLQLDFATNEFLLVFWVLTFAIFVVARMVGQRLLSYIRTRGKNLRSIVIVGEGSDASALADRIEKEPTLGYRVVQIIDAKES